MLLLLLVVVVLLLLLHSPGSLVSHTHAARYGVQNVFLIHLHVVTSPMGLPSRATELLACLPSEMQYADAAGDVCVCDRLGESKYFFLTL
jgi:hypothetical protein